MKELPLTKGKIAFVDDEDFERVIQHRWYAHSQGYAVANEPTTVKGKYRKMLLHRFILNAPSDIHVDHINGNKLDNRKCNLRFVNMSQNKANCGVRSNNTIGYKGVAFISRGNRKKRYMARIKVDYKGIYLGYYETAEEAALAYNKAALKYFGEYAQLNDVPQE